MVLLYYLITTASLTPTTNFPQSTSAFVCDFLVSRSLLGGKTSSWAVPVYWFVLAAYLPLVLVVSSKAAADKRRMEIHAGNKEAHYVGCKSSSGVIWLKTDDCCLTRYSRLQTENMLSTTSTSITFFLSTHERYTLLYPVTAGTQNPNLGS